MVVKWESWKDADDQDEVKSGLGINTDPQVAKAKAAIVQPTLQQLSSPKYDLECRGYVVGAQIKEKSYGLGTDALHVKDIMIITDVNEDTQLVHVKQAFSFDPKAKLFAGIVPFDKCKQQWTA